MQTQTLAMIIILVFVAILMFLGWYIRKWILSGVDYLIAGREISLPVNIMGLCATAFAGSSLVLIPGLAIRLGLFGAMGLVLSFTILGVSLYGLVLAPYIRRSGAYTLPEWIEMRYSAQVRSLIAVLALVMLVGITANNVVALATVMTGYFGWPLLVTLTLGVVTFLFFTYCSGLWGVTITDFLQAALVVIAVPVLVTLVFNTFGSPVAALSNWPGEGGFFFHGISNARMPLLSATYPSALSMIIIFSLYTIISSQHYWIRVSSVRNEHQAKWSFFWAGIILFFLNMSLVYVGLFAGVNFKELFMPFGQLPPEAAYGVVLGHLPASAGIFLLVVAVAASLSTASTTLIAAISVGVRDIYQRNINPGVTSTQLVRPSRIITILIGLAVWVLCFYPGGPAFLFAFSTAWAGPAGILLIIGILWPRANAQGALAGVIIGGGSMTIWTILDLMKIYPVNTIAHVGIVGLITTIIPIVVVSLLTQPKYYGKKEWKVVAVEGSSLDVV